MNKEDKILLLKDLCARLPYGTICLLSANGTSITEELKLGGLDLFMSGRLEVRPYLRPKSSMTEGEKKKLGRISCEGNIEHKYGIFYRSQDYLNSIHVDYRDLISKGLALEAPQKMYK